MIAELKNPFSIFRRRIGFRFDNYAWIRMCELTGVEFDQLEQLEENELVLGWLYGAYYSYCAFKNKRRKLSFEQIAKMYRYYYIKKPQELDKVKQAILDGKVMGKPIRDHAGSEKKK